MADLTGLEEPQNSAWSQSGVNSLGVPFSALFIHASGGGTGSLSD